VLRARRDDGGRTLFVGDLPQFWAGAEVAEFFSEFGPVEDARVIGSQVHGRLGPKLISMSSLFPTHASC
jgi:hypothetical protein